MKRTPIITVDNKQLELKSYTVLIDFNVSRTGNRSKEMNNDA